MNTPNHFVIVDDDPINNMICKTVIKKLNPNAVVTSFTAPEEGMQYFRNAMPADDLVLLLDINMPDITGWDFLDEFERLSNQVKSQVSVFILSSSVDSRDKERAAANLMVKRFMSKPLTVEALLSALGQQQY